MKKMFSKRQLKYVTPKRKLDDEYCHALHCKKTPTVYTQAYTGWVNGKPKLEQYYWCDEHKDKELEKVQMLEDKTLNIYESAKKVLK